MTLNKDEKNNLYYLCSIVEYLGRKTNNKRDYIVSKLGRNTMEYIYTKADILHCDSIHSVCEEIIEDCNIEQGNYDINEYCYDKPPRALAIGKLYSKLIISLLEENNFEEDVIDKTIEVLSSWLVFKITNFNSSLYYSVVDYLKECYLRGEIIDY